MVCNKLPPIVQSQKKCLKTKALYPVKVWNRDPLVGDLKQTIKDYIQYLHIIITELVITILRVQVSQRTSMEMYKDPCQ